MRMDKRIDEIRARCEAATPEPWVLGNNQGLVLDNVGHKIICDPILCKDSVFIAHAREDVPWLLDHIARLERAIKQKWKACSTCAKKPSEGYCDDLYDCINEYFTYPCWEFDWQRFGEDKDGERDG